MESAAENLSPPENAEEVKQTEAQPISPPAALKDVDLDFEEPAGSPPVNSPPAMRRQSVDHTGPLSPGAALAGQVRQPGTPPKRPPPLGLSATTSRDASPSRRESQHPSPDPGRVKPPEGRRPPEVEDRPYNVICNLDKVNLGGPGWFNDVMDISVELDTEQWTSDTLAFALVPRHSFNRRCALFHAGAPIKGFIKLTPPPGKKVWIWGLKVDFEEHLLVLDMDRSDCTGAMEVTVEGRRYIEGEVKIPFTVDPGELEKRRGWPLRDTYVGEMLALRHQLVVTACRSWWTFDVVRHVPLMLERLDPGPEETVGHPNEEGGPNHVMIIPDCSGRCEFDMKVDTYNLDSVLEGVARFTGVTRPLVAAHVVILKAEFMYGNAFEIVVGEHTILGHRHNQEEQSHPLVNSSREELQRIQEMSPFVDTRHRHFSSTQEENLRTEPVRGEAEIPVRLDLSQLPLTPTFLSLAHDIQQVASEEELVGVRYYIRLIAEDAKKSAYWNTHEIFFHRATLSSEYTEDETDEEDAQPEPEPQGQAEL